MTHLFFLYFHSQKPCGSCQMCIFHRKHYDTHCGVQGRCGYATAAGASFASETLCATVVRLGCFLMFLVSNALSSCSIGNFSEFSYRRTTLRGMRTTRIRKMAAAAAALRRECASRRTLFLFPMKISYLKRLPVYYFPPKLQYQLLMSYLY